MLLRGSTVARYEGVTESRERNSERPSLALGNEVSSVFGEFLAYISGSRERKARRWPSWSAATSGLCPCYKPPAIVAAP